MKKFMLLLPLAITFASCGTSPTEATLNPQSQPMRQAWDVATQAIARNCATSVAIKMVDNNYYDYAFVTPGATCTNEFLGADALTLYEGVKVTSIVASDDLKTVNVTAISRTNRKYMYTMDGDLNVTFNGWVK